MYIPFLTGSCRRGDLQCSYKAYVKRKAKQARNNNFDDAQYHFTVDATDSVIIGPISPVSTSNTRYIMTFTDRH